MTVGLSGPVYPLLLPTAPNTNKDKNAEFQRDFYPRAPRACAFFLQRERLPLAHTFTSGRGLTASSGDGLNQPHSAALAPLHPLNLVRRTRAFLSWQRLPKIPEAPGSEAEKALDSPPSPRLRFPRTASLWRPPPRSWPGPNFPLSLHKGGVTVRRSRIGCGGGIRGPCILGGKYGLNTIPQGGSKHLPWLWKQLDEQFQLEI